MHVRRVAALSMFFACMVSGAVMASPALQRDSTGNEVLLLQKKLQSIGYAVTELDGVFGDETERAVEEFQRDQNLQETGIVNRETWRALKNARADPIRLRELIEEPVETFEEPIDNPVEEYYEEYYDESYTESNESPQIFYAPYGETIIDSALAGAIIETAEDYLGVPYVFGGTTPSGFDCSGFIQYIFAKFDVSIPRLADEQYLLGERSATEDLVPGDLVFFTTYEEGASHCGLYLGEREFIHVASSRGVSISSLDDYYWQPRFLGGKHIVR